MKYFLIILAIICAFLVGHYRGKQFVDGKVERVVILKKELRTIIVDRKAERTVADEKIVKISKKFEETKAIIDTFSLDRVSENIPDSKVVDSLVCLPESTAKEYLVLKEQVVADSQIISVLKEDRDSADSKLNQYVTKTDTLLDVMEKSKKDAINSSYKRGIIHGAIGTGLSLLILGVVIWF